MIKNILNVILLAGIVGLTSQCQPSAPTESTTDSNTENVQSDSLTQNTLYARLESSVDPLSLQDSMMIRFTVTNPTADTLKFSAYHTPFEGLISKFLTVTDSAGQEISYQGPMAKRVMPPPAESYHNLAPQQEESTSFDLKKIYKIEKAGSYTLQYNGGEISGMDNGEPITIHVVE